MIKTNIVNLKIFLIFFIFRYLFVSFSGFDNFELQPDSYWYIEQSNSVVNGNFNLLRPLFITSPFFSYLQALFIYLFQENWMIFLEFFQIFFCSISGVYFYHLSKLILLSKSRSYLSTFIFCFYPLTFWYSGTFTQDVWFQSFLIIFFYYFLCSLKFDNFKYLLISAIIFSITFHTKSHILLFSPFIPIIILLRDNLNLRIKIKFIIYFTFISLFSTLPYGIYNLNINNTYVIGSSGLGGTLIQGNNEEAYLNHLKLDTLTPEQLIRFKDVRYKILDQLKAEINGKNPKEVQQIYIKHSLIWIKENPVKKVELMISHLVRFLTPGISKFWYSFNKWLAVLLLSSPIYICFYLVIIHETYLKFFKNKIGFFHDNIWIIFLILSQIVFTLIFYYSGRFRVITLEPYYIIYAIFILDKFKKLNYFKKQ